MNTTNITIVGAGYVGMSLAVLLAQHNRVCVLDIDVDRVVKINRRQTTVADADIEAFLAEKLLLLSATTDKREAYARADFIIVATPTDYDIATSQFDTTSVDAVVADALTLNERALVVIKSTVSVGHTGKLQQLHQSRRVIFSPEFLREGQALRDNLFPDRIIVGDCTDKAVEFAKLLQQGAEKVSIETLFMPSAEAEAVKLFSNSYLAMRVAFFNELDSFALTRELNTRSIIAGVCLDGRIGAGYNNPSFGYGGYCLPKDTQQLLASFGNIPQNLMQAVVSSNNTRQELIVQQILKRAPVKLGIFHLVGKENSDNIRSSAVLYILNRLLEEDISVLIYEPLLEGQSYLGAPLIDNLMEFKASCDLIIANRVSNDLSDVRHKLFSRDVFFDS